MVDSFIKTNKTINKYLVARKHFIDDTDMLLVIAGLWYGPAQNLTLDKMKLLIKKGQFSEINTCINHGYLILEHMSFVEYTEEIKSITVQMYVEIVRIVTSLYDLGIRATVDKGQLDGSVVDNSSNDVKKLRIICDKRISHKTISRATQVFHNQ